MNNRKNPVYHDFNERKAELQKNRATLQGYLDVVSSSFGSTGLTIYQVIGHAIKTAENIESLPKNLRRLRIPNVESMNRTKVDTLVSDLDIFGSRLDQLIHMPVLWRQSAITDISRNSVEDHIETAGEIAASLRKLEVDISTSEISALMLPDPFKIDIDRLKNIFSQFACEKNKLDINVIEKLVDPKNLCTIRNFSGEIAMREKLIEQLRQDLHAPEDANISTELAAVAEFAKNQGSRLDPALHHSRIAKLKQEFSNLQSIARAVKKLPQVWISANWNLAEISKASQRIAAQPTHILGLRHADPHDEAHKVMLEIKTMKSRLETELQNIRKFLPTPNDSLEPDRLRQQACTLDNPGLLDYVNGIYWAARNTYTNVLDGYRGDHPTKMAHHMREYANWLDTCREFGLNNRYCEYFGPYFKGLQTKMNSITDIVKFHELCAEIAGSDVELKTCLESSDLASIVDFSEIKNIPNMKYQDLVDKISTLEQTIVKEKHFAGVATKYLEIFRTDSALSFDKISEIQARKQRETEITKATKNVSSKFTALDLEHTCNIAESIASCDNHGIILSLLQSGKINEIIIEFENLSIRIDKICTKIKKFFQDIGVPEDFFPLTDLLKHIDDFQIAADDMNSLLNRNRLTHAEQSIRNYGFGPLIDWGMKQRDAFDPACFGPIARALIARTMADIAYETHSVLKEYAGTDLNIIRTKIRSRDKEMTDISRTEIIRLLLESAKPPSGNHIGRKSEYTELALVLHELHKKKQRISIRELTKRAGKALVEIKPCWMMSPLAVAQYLTSEMRFDMVIIDEASQMTPENAIGSVSRANQVIIVGDTKQLPPTNFFQTLLDESNTDEDLIEDSESILEMANSVFAPVRQLRWHYRSRHSSLIEFSNQFMYDGNLTVFPSAQEKHPELGVKLIETGGIYKNRRNKIEAEKIISAAIIHISEYPELSLGICTMNTEQKELIREQFEQERDRNSKIRDFINKWEQKDNGLEEFFIKNIETVQGDERDVIMISTLYGPQKKNEKVLQRFGPINSTYGARRLNVLFTRAKRKMVTFTSLKPSDIITADKNEGVHMFQAWLEYSKNGTIPVHATSKGETESPFEDFVMAQIKQFGYEVVPQVGVRGFRIDLGVRNPDSPANYILAVECDGASYHSSVSSRERDRLRQDILEGLGWRFHRIWSTDWFQNTASEIKSLKKAIENAVSEARAQKIQDDEQVCTRQVSPVSNFDGIFNEENVRQIKAMKENYDKSHQLDMSQQFEQQTLPMNLPTEQGILPLDFQNEDSEQLSEEIQISEKLIIATGSKVRLKNITNDKELAFTLVEGKNDPDNGEVGIHTPLGKAVLDREIGEETEYQAGSYINKIQILKIEHPLKKSEQKQ